MRTPFFVNAYQQGDESKPGIADRKGAKGDHRRFAKTDRDRIHGL